MRRGKKTMVDKTGSAKEMGIGPGIDGKRAAAAGAPEGFWTIILAAGRGKRMK